MAEETEWLEVEAAARYLDFHINTIYRMVRDGQLPALRFPVRIHRDDLDTLLDRCRITPGELRTSTSTLGGTTLPLSPRERRRAHPTVATGLG